MASCVWISFDCLNEKFYMSKHMSWSISPPTVHTLFATCASFLPPFLPPPFPFLLTYSQITHEARSFSHLHLATVQQEFLAQYFAAPRSLSRPCLFPVRISLVVSLLLRQNAPTEARRRGGRDAKMLEGTLRKGGRAGGREGGREDCIRGPASQTRSVFALGRSPRNSS
jgi:hypothetical protein